jgi:hypothetical protein
MVVVRGGTRDAFYRNGADPSTSRTCNAGHPGPPLRRLLNTTGRAAQLERRGAGGKRLVTLSLDRRARGAFCAIVRRRTGPRASLNARLKAAFRFVAPRRRPPPANRAAPPTPPPPPPLRPAGREASCLRHKARYIAIGGLVRTISVKPLREDGSGDADESRQPFHRPGFLRGSPWQRAQQVTMSDHRIAQSRPASPSGGAAASRCSGGWPRRT